MQVDLSKPGNENKLDSVEYLLLCKVLLNDFQLVLKNAVLMSGCVKQLLQM